MERALAAGNIVLIGMPGVGKSTLGVLLAKQTSRRFIDTDVDIQAGHGLTLREIIATDGPAAFRAIEERCILALDCRDTVIATGGSVVYGARAMRHLQSLSVIVHLDLPLDLVRLRLVADATVFPLYFHVPTVGAMAGWGIPTLFGGDFFACTPVL